MVMRQKYKKYCRIVARKDRRGRAWGEYKKGQKARGRGGGGGVVGGGSYRELEFSNFETDGFLSR